MDPMAVTRESAIEAKAAVLAVQAEIPEVGVPAMGRAKRGRNRTGRLFCLMARSLVRSKDIALGGFYRRMAARRGGLIATMALARKLAAWFWRVMVKGDAYIEKGLADYNNQVLQSKQRALKRLAKELGQQLIPIAQPA